MLPLNIFGCISFESISDYVFTEFSLGFMTNWINFYEFFLDFLDFTELTLVLDGCLSFRFQ